MRGFSGLSGCNYGPPTSVSTTTSVSPWGMVPKNQGEVRVQFHQDPASAATATFAVWYQEIGTMQSVSFSPVGSLRPELLQENRGVAIFDLNGDGRADLHLAGQPNP